MTFAITMTSYNISFATLGLAPFGLTTSLLIKIKKPQVRTWGFSFLLSEAWTKRQPSRLWLDLLANEVSPLPKILIGR